MEQELLLASLGLTLIVVVGGFLILASAARGARPVADMPGASSDAGHRLPRFVPTEIAAIVLPFLAFAVTLPSKPPFAAGHGLGTGFLIGGVGALLLALGARRTTDPTVGGLVVALPTLAAGIPLWLMRGELLDALFGVAIGWFGVTFLLYVARPEERASYREALIAGSGCTVAVTATFLLGTLRDSRTEQLPRGTWSTAALAFSAGASLLLRIGASLRAGTDSTVGRARAVAIATIGIAGILALLLGIKFVDERRLIALLVIGLLLFPLIYWLQISAAGGERPGKVRLRRPLGASVPFLSVILVASASMIGGQLMQGYGFALALVALFVAWAAMRAIDPPSEPGTPGAEALRLLLFGAALALYRVSFARWNDDLHGQSLSDQYALFGFVVGAGTPFLVQALATAARLGKPQGTRPIVASLIAGLLSLVIPGAVVLVFGPKCVITMILGAAIAGVFAEDLLPLLLAIAMALALDQWLGYLLPYADIARIVKLKALAIVVAVTLAALAISAGRRGSGEIDAAQEGQEPQ